MSDPPPPSSPPALPPGSVVLVYNASLVFVYTGIALGVLVVLFVLVRVFVGSDAASLKVKLELVLCKRETGKKAITVSPLSVYLAYAIPVFFVAYVLAALAVTIACIVWMTQADPSGNSLFSTVGNDENGIALASLLLFLIQIVALLYAAYKAYSLVSALYLDPQFGEIVSAYRSGKLKEPATGLSPRANAADVGDALPLLACST